MKKHRPSHPSKCEQKSNEQGQLLKEQEGLSDGHGEMQEEMPSSMYISFEKEGILFVYTMGEYESEFLLNKEEVQGLIENMSEWIREQGQNEQAHSDRPLN